MRVRKTVDCWRFYVNYGQGWEHEITEFTLGTMRVNRKAYQENCAYPLRIKRGRMNKTELKPWELESIEQKKAEERKARMAKLLAKRKAAV